MCGVIKMTAINCEPILVRRSNKSIGRNAHLHCTRRIGSSGEDDFIRHCTRVPIWSAQRKQEPHREGQLSLGGCCMKNAILLSVLLLLSACATHPPVGGATDAEQAHRPSASAPPPAASQKSVPAEMPQPASGVPGDMPPKKPKHNVEED